MASNHYIALLAFAALLLAGAPVWAQSGDNGLGEDEQRIKEFAEVMGTLQTASIVMSLERARARQGNRVNIKGNELNPVLAASPPEEYSESRTLGSAPVEPPVGVSECVNPPEQQRARYVVAFVDVAPRIDPVTGGRSGFRLDESVLAETVSERFMPEKLRPGQPGVTIFVNQGEAEWAYQLDDAWSEHDDARRWLQMKLEDVSPDAAACKLARAVEALLEQADSMLISDMIRKHELGQKLDAVRARLDEVESTTEREAHGTPVFRTEMHPALVRATEKVEAARTALDRGAYPSAHNALEAASDSIADANDAYGTLLSLRTDATLLRERIGDASRASELRRNSWLPGGEELDQTLRRCQERVATFDELAQKGVEYERARSAREDARACLQEFSTLKRRTSDRFHLIVYVLPIGLGGTAALGALILLAARRGRRQTLEYEVMPVLSEWEQMVPMFDRRVARLERQHSDLFDAGESEALGAGLEPRDIDVVDRAFALAARSRAILDEAVQLESDASTLRPAPLEECLALLTQRESELTPSNTREDTPIRRGLRELETIEHRRMIEATDDATRRASDILDALNDEQQSPQSW
jgi:hypothetical protein